MDGSRNTIILGSILTGLAVLLLISSAAASEGYPYTGVVNGNDANLRAGPNLNYEIVTQVQKGDLLYVADKWMQWLKVRVPDGTLLWASAEYIQNGKVIANKLNVRSGPDLKYNTVYQLAEDDDVVVVKTSKDGKWAGIKAPGNAYLCIHEELVDKIGGPRLFEQHAQRTAALSDKLRKLELRRELYMKKPPEEVPFDELISEYDGIAKEYSEFKDEAARAAKRAEELRTMKKNLEDKIVTAQKAEQEQQKQKEETDTEETKTQFVARFLTSKGRLVPAEGKAGEEGFMKIMRGSKALCVAKSDVILLKLYKNRNVQIWGKEEFSDVWNIPLINVTKIEEQK